MKKFLAVLMSIFMMVAVIGCGTTSNNTQSTPEGSKAATQTNDNQAPTATNEKIEILVWTFLNPSDTSGRGKVLQEVIDKYEDMYPNVKVRVESQQWDTMSAKFFAAHQTGNAPDVIFVNVTNLGEAIKLGAVEPLENLFLSEWSQEQIDDINDVRFHMGATNDTHYQAYMFVNAYGIIYRADLFEKFGIDPNFKTWDDVLAAAQKLTFTDPETGMKVWGLGTGYSEDAADSSYLLTAIVTNFGDVIDENGKAAWDNEIGAEALQFQVDLVNKYGVMPPSCITQTSEEVYADFTAGKFAMITGGSVRIPKLRSESTFDPNAVQITAFPAINGNPGKGLSGGWNVCIWSKSKHKEEAGRFLELMISPEFDKRWVEEGGQVPMLKSTVEGMKEFFAQPQNQYLSTTLDILQKNAAVNSTKFAESGYPKDLNKAMQLVMVEGYTIEQALAKTAQEFNERNGN